MYVRIIFFNVLQCGLSFLDGRHGARRAALFQSVMHYLDAAAAAVCFTHTAQAGSPRCWYHHCLAIQMIGGVPLTGPNPLFEREK
jgi:hypothetical protein